MILQETILIIFYFVTLFFSIILHEIAHGLVAFWLGDYTAKHAGRLTLDPVKHVDFFGSILAPLFMLFMTNGTFVFGWAKPVPVNPYALRGGKWGPALVSIAGPLTNFLIASFSAIIAFFLSISTPEKTLIFKSFISSDWNDLLSQVAGNPLNILFAILTMLIFWNVLLGVFNLIPIPPLDGSKILFTFFQIKDEAAFFLQRWGMFILLIFLFSPLAIFFHKIIKFLWAIFYNIAIYGSLF